MNVISATCHPCRLLAGVFFLDNRPVYSVYVDSAELTTVRLINAGKCKI